MQHDELARFARQLSRKGYECCCLYLIDSAKLTERNALLTNLLIAQCVYLNMALPFVLVTTKTDLVPEERLNELLNDDDYEQPDAALANSNDFYTQVRQLVLNAGLANAVRLCCDDEEAIGRLQQEIDFVIHYDDI